MTSAAVAQSEGTPIETPPVPSPTKKQAIVKEQARRKKVPEAHLTGPVTVGTIIPDNVALWALLQDSMSEVPAVTSYKFLLTGKSIAVVDPESRKVIQIIPN